jgi:uncharacterized protein (TIGR03435 family)
MTKWLLSFGALVAVLIAAVYAQDVAGIWQGTVQIQGRDIRLQFRVTSDGGLKGLMYSLDQGSGAIPATVTVQSGSVKFDMPGIGGRYEGRLSADGTTLDGKMSQLGAPGLSLVLKKVTAEAAWVPPAPPSRPAAMPVDANPSFEVATIKASRPETPGQSITIRGRTFGTQNQTVAGMMTFAYGLHPDQIIGGPDWMRSDRFDISAEPEGTGMPNDRQWKSMLAKLLGDRYKLTFHKDKKELSVYALTMLKTGHKLTKNNTDANGLPALFFRGLGIFPVRNATMQEFAGTMQAVVLDRPVVDQTGIDGRYDFTLQWTPDETQFGGRGGQAPPPADPSTVPPGLFTAIQEQLGLKLDATKMSADVFVIERLEKPTPN